MEKSEIEKELKKLYATMTSVEKPAQAKKPTKEAAEAAGPPPFVPVQPQQVAEEAVLIASPCFNKCCVDLLKSLSKTNFIGGGGIEATVVALLEQFPECSVGAS